jgi:hypothetical protein
VIEPGEHIDSKAETLNSVSGQEMSASDISNAPGDEAAYGRLVGAHEAGHCDQEQINEVLSDRTMIRDAALSGNEGAAQVFMQARALRGQQVIRENAEVERSGKGVQQPQSYNTHLEIDVDAEIQKAREELHDTSIQAGFSENDGVDDWAELAIEENEQLMASIPNIAAEPLDNAALNEISAVGNNASFKIDLILRILRSCIQNIS